MAKTILELKFEEEIRDKMFLAKKECNYNPTRFHQMITNHGGAGTAKRLIAQAQKPEIHQMDLPHFIFAIGWI